MWSFFCNLFSASGRPEPVLGPAVDGPVPIPDGPSEVEADPPAPSFPEPAAYAHSDELFEDELKRVEQLLRAEVFRRRGLTGGTDAVIQGRFGWEATVVNPDCRVRRDRAAAAAEEWETYITARLRLTEDGVRATLKPWRLADEFRLVSNLSQVVPPFGKLPTTRLPRDSVRLNVILLAVLADRVPRYRWAVADLPTDDGATAGELTAGTVLRAAEPDAEPARLRWAELAAGSPLIDADLIALGPADHPARRTVRPDPAVADFLFGTDVLDPALGDAARIVDQERPVNSLPLDEEVRQSIHRLAKWIDGGAVGVGPPPRLTVLFHGPYGSPLLGAARTLWVRSKRPLLAIDTARAPAGADWPAYVRRVYRTARFNGWAVFWESAEVVLNDPAGPARWDALTAAAEVAPLPTLIGSATAWDAAGAFREPRRYFVRIECAVPSSEVRRHVWAHRLRREGNPLLGDGHPDPNATLDTLAAFPFTEGQIDDAMAAARGMALAANPDCPVPDADELFEGCRRQSARRLVSFATRIRPRPDPAIRDRDPHDVLADRVVLPPRPRVQLAELFDRMRHRTLVYRKLGLGPRHGTAGGLVALFAGPSGTGKTHAAVALAELLGTDVYKVDLAAVVSKFVGETEKNLGKVFADAQDANAVLFFDEADALFGKRGEVEQAQDRWANLEVNYLLQRVEDYSGTVVLATNLRQNIDAAFARRVQVLIDFPRPTAEARLRILRGLFRDTRVPTPDEATVLAPVAERLTELSGGNLRNVVVDAVFRAVEETAGGTVQVRIEHLILAAAREYLKMGLLVAPATFGRDWTDLATAKLMLGPA